jgi:hypothetical protein
MASHLSKVKFNRKTGPTSYINRLEKAAGKDIMAFVNHSIGGVAGATKDHVLNLVDHKKRQDAARAFQERNDRPQAPL